MFQRFYDEGLAHACILAQAPGQPARLFTGDLLFVGAVGRPDLLGEAQTRRLANDIFDSLQRIVAPMNVVGGMSAYRALETT
jgi:glyoxylase-like metal-dependent hydrolase (beta-lactamase superfamily II)